MDPMAPTALTCSTTDDRGSPAPTIGSLQIDLATARSELRTVHEAWALDRAELRRLRASEASLERALAQLKNGREPLVAAIRAITVGALSDDTKALREAAETFFGGDFGRPPPDPAKVQP